MTAILHSFLVDNLEWGLGTDSLLFEELLIEREMIYGTTARYTNVARAKQVTHPV